MIKEVEYAHNLDQTILNSQFPNVEGKSIFSYKRLMLRTQNIATIVILSTSYWVNISQLIRFARASSHVADLK